MDLTHTDLTHNEFNNFIYNNNYYSFYGIKYEYEIDDLLKPFLTHIHNKSVLQRKDAPFYVLLNIFFNTFKSAIVNPFFFNRFIKYAQNSYLDILGKEYNIIRPFIYPFDTHDIIKSFTDEDYRDYINLNRFGLNYDYNTLNDFYNLDLFIKSPDEKNYSFTSFFEFTVSYKYSKNLQNNYYTTWSSAQLGKYIVKLKDFNTENDPIKIESIDIDCFLDSQLFKYHIPVYTFYSEFHNVKDNSDSGEKQRNVYRFKETVLPFINDFYVVDNKCFVKLDTFYPLSDTSSDKPLRVTLNIGSYDIYKRGEGNQVRKPNFIVHDVIDLNDENKSYYLKFDLDEMLIIDLTEKFKSLFIEVIINDSLFWNDFKSLTEVFYPLDFNDYYIPLFKFYSTRDFYNPTHDEIISDTGDNDLKTHRTYNEYDKDKNGNYYTYDSFFNMKEHPGRYNYNNFKSIETILKDKYFDIKQIDFIETF